MADTTPAAPAAKPRRGRPPKARTLHHRYCSLDDLELAWVRRAAEHQARSEASVIRECVRAAMRRGG